MITEGREVVIEVDGTVALYGGDCALDCGDFESDLGRVDLKCEVHDTPYEDIEHNSIGVLGLR